MRVFKEALHACRLAGFALMLGGFLLNSRR
jgi:drug/metabolite transporter (DMT)-like permease